MHIHGLQKLTLLDYPGHTACTVFTGGCNYRCPFCHNATLVLRPAEQPLLAEDEVLSFLKKRQGLLDGVCITGGEPTLEKGLADFAARVKELGFAVKLDSNGSRPEVLRGLVEKKLLDYIAMDIKNSPARYAETVGLSSVRFSAFEESVEMIKNCGLPYEFRTTVVKEFHTKEDFLAIGEWLKGAKTYALQAFKDSGNLIQPGLSGYSRDELMAFRELLTPYFDEVLLRGID